MSSKLIATRFRLHLRPRDQSSSSAAANIPPLPVGKTIVDVFADFLRYMKRSARTYIEETHLEGVKDQLEPGKEVYILSHPNGWGAAQKTLMRKAAVKAELIQDKQADYERVSFVTEGEASLNFCITKGLMNDSIRASRHLCPPLIPTYSRFPIALSWRNHS